LDRGGGARVRKFTVRCHDDRGGAPTKNQRANGRGEKIESGPYELWIPEGTQEAEKPSSPTEKGHGGKKPTFISAKKGKGMCGGEKKKRQIREKP